MKDLVWKKASRSTPCSSVSSGKNIVPNLIVKLNMQGGVSQLYFTQFQISSATLQDGEAVREKNVQVFTFRI